MTRRKTTSSSNVRPECVQSPESTDMGLTESPRPPLKLGWFSTGRGQGSLGLLAAALDAIDDGRLNATIRFVFCNRERGERTGSDRFMDFVESRKIALVTLSSRSFRRDHENRPWSELRESFDLAAADLLKKYDPDLSVNAGYMLIAPVLCRVFRMINVHPALPTGPAGMWNNVIWDLIEQRADVNGVMVHLVTEDVDGGPVLSYCSYPIRGPQFDAHWVGIKGRKLSDVRRAPGEDLPLFRAIREAGLLRERPLLVETLCAVADGRLDLELAEGGGGVLSDLTEVVERALGRVAGA